MNINDKIWARGFLLTKLNSNIKSPKEDWVYHEIGNENQRFIIYFDSANLFSYKSKYDYWVFILGTAMDTQDWHMDLDVIADKLLECLNVSQLCFYDYLDTLCGRHVIIYGNDTNTWLLQDATGMRSVFYHTEETYVASHYNLIAEYVKCKQHPYWNNFKQSKTVWLLPGNITPLENIIALTANQELDLNILKHKRFFPREDVKFYDIDEIIDIISDNIKKQINVLTKNYKVAFSLTRGFDSRLSLAATRENADLITYFTYKNTSVINETKDILEREKDCSFSVDLCEKYHLHHKVLELKNEVNNEVLSVLNKNHYHRHIAGAPIEYHNELSNHTMHLRSNLTEIIRKWLWKSNGHAIDNFMTWAGYFDDSDGRCRKLFIDFYNECQYDKIYNYDIARLFYWEYRMSLWMNAAVLVEWDIATDTYMLFNCRKLLMLGLSLNNEILNTNIIPIKCINKLWPELLFNLPNSTHTLLDYYNYLGTNVLDIKNECRIISYNKKDPTRKVFTFCEKNLQSAYIGFSSHMLKEGDVCELFFDKCLEKDVSYFSQISLMSNWIQNSKINCKILMDNDMLYNYNCSAFPLKFNQINILFKAKECRTSRIRICLEVNEDVSGLHNGQILIDKIIMKKEIGISYNDYNIHIFSSKEMAQNVDRTIL